MADCISDSDITSAINSPRGDDTTTSHDEASKANEHTIRDTAQELADEGIENTSTAENINSTINESGMPPDNSELSHQDEAAARSAANIILESYAIEGEELLWDKRDAAYATAAETTRSKATFVQNIISSAESKLRNSTAPIAKWILHFAGTEGDQAINNPIYAHFNAITANAVGYTQYFTKKYIDPLVAQSKQIARKNGLSTDEVMRDIGEYARAEHTSEGNAELLRSWQRIIDAEIAKGEEGDPNVIAKYTQRIDDLTENIDNPRPYNEDGGRSCYTSTGWTDAEADTVMAELQRKYNMSDAELSAHAQVLRDMNAEIQERRASEGHMTREEVEALPQFMKFIPIRTRGQLSLGALNDAATFNPGSLHARDGIRDAPVLDGYSSLMKFLRYASTEHSYRDFGLDLAALAARARAEQRDIGLHIMEYGPTMRRLVRGDISVFRQINSEDGMAMVVNIPVVDDKGERRISRKLITFDINWEDRDLNTGLTGADINKAFNFHERGVAALTIPTKLTSWRAQTFTRFNPGFAPKNAIADSWERLNSMVTQSYTLEDGRTIPGWKLLPSYMAHFPKAMNILFGIMDGSMDRKSANGKIWKEYVDGGLLQEFTPGRDTNQSDLAKALVPPGSEVEKQITTNKHLQGLRNALSTLNDATLRKVINALDAYNSYFNNIASFTQYLTLREHGVTRESARDNVLVVMNLRQSGTWTPVMRALFPFTKPTMQGAASMFRSAGLAPNARGEFRPSLRGAAALVGNMMALSLMMPLARAALGEDKDGNNRMDSISFGEAIRSLPICIDKNTGEYFKLPFGFGIMQVGAALTLGYDRLQRGIIAPEDYAAEVVASIARNVSPADWPTFAMSQDPFKWLASMFTPDIAKPVVETAMNIGYNGGSLTYGDPHSATPMALQGRKSTESWYHNIALSLMKSTGLNVAPEQVKHFIEGTLTGPLRIISTIYNKDSLRAAGVDKTNAEILGPVTGALFGLSILHGTAANLNVRRGYDELNRLKSEIRRLGVKTTDSRAYTSSDRAEREQWLRRQLMNAGMDTRRIEQYLILSRAESDVQQLSRLLNKTVVHGNWFDDENLDRLRSEFVRYSGRRDTIFSNALRQAGFR